MSTQIETSVLRRRSVGIITPRLLGTLGIFGAPFLFLEGITHYILNINGSSPLGGFLELFYLGGWMCSIAGLGMLQAAGQGKTGKVILSLQLLGLTLAVVFSVSNIVLPDLNPDTLVFQITDIAWPLSHLFMVVVGVAVVVAGRMSGWTRFAPLACGLTLPVSLGIAAPLGAEDAGLLLFGPFTWVAFTLLGYAVRTGQKS